MITLLFYWIVLLTNKAPNQSLGVYLYCNVIDINSFQTDLLLIKKKNGCYVLVYHINNKNTSDNGYLVFVPFQCENYRSILDYNWIWNIFRWRMAWLSSCVPMELKKKPHSTFRFYSLNLSDLFVKIVQAYDLETVSREMIKKTCHWNRWSVAIK